MLIRSNETLTRTKPIKYNRNLQHYQLHLCIPMHQRNKPCNREVNSAHLMTREGYCSLQMAGPEMTPGVKLTPLLLDKILQMEVDAW